MVIHTPGHTKDSICLYEKNTKSLFSGDTIFVDGVGRTDFPTGNFSLLKKSVEKLVELEKIHGIKKLYPGHGQIGTGRDIIKIYEEYLK